MSRLSRLGAGGRVVDASADQWRVGAYAICRRGDEVLLVRASSQTLVEGRWFLPGGGLELGEDPEAGVLRELHEETGLTGRRPRILRAFTELIRRDEDRRLFALRLVYEVDVDDGQLRHEVDGTSDEARWVPLKKVEAIGVTPYVRRALGLGPA